MRFAAFVAALAAAASAFGAVVVPRLADDSVPASLQPPRPTLIQQKLDDEFPEISGALLQTLYPHYLAPIPSLGLLQFDLDAARVQELAERFEAPVEAFDPFKRVAFDSKKLKLEASDVAPTAAVAVGQTGVSVSELRPMGVCAFGPDRVEASAEHGTIPPGSAVEVIAMVDRRPIVRALT